MKKVTKKSTSHGKWRGMCKIFTEFKKVKEEIPKKAVLIKRNSIYYIYFILYEING